MKIFSNVFDLAKPTGRKFNVETNSDYAIGIKIANDGVAQEGTIKLFLGETELSAEADKVDGFTIYNRTSGSSKESNEYQVVYVNDGVSSYFDLLENVCDTGVFEKGGSGGGGSYTLPVATTEELGGVKIGDNISIDADGKISAPAAYTLSAATTETLGGVKLGNNVTVDANGALSASESDPAFNNWLSGESIAIGGNASADASYSLAIGNSAQAKRDETIAIGHSSSSNSSNGISIGHGAINYSSYGITIGDGASTYIQADAISIGKSSQAYGARCICIGGEAKTTSSRQDCIQLGTGTNTTNGTFQVWSFPLLTMSTGLLTPERMGTGYDATKTQVLKNVNGTLTWVDEA